MPVLPQPTPMRASRRGPLHGLPDSNTRSLEGARLQPADLNGESPGVVNFNEQDWSLSNEREHRQRIGVGDLIISRRNDPTIGVYDATDINKPADPVRNGNRWRVHAVDTTAEHPRIAAR